MSSDKQCKNIVTKSLRFSAVKLNLAQLKTVPKIKTKV